MSEINSTAATRATPVSPNTSFHASSESSQDASVSHPRSPSPEGRSSKRRRVESAFPEIPANSNHFNTSDGSNHYLSHHLASQSAPNLPVLVSGARPFEPQPRTFLGHDREFMSHILSTRGVAHWPRATTRHRLHIPSFRSAAEHLPVISADNASFIGWREKADTWPMEKGRHMQQSFTFPQ